VPADHGGPSPPVVWPFECGSRTTGAGRLLPDECQVGLAVDDRGRLEPGVDGAHEPLEPLLGLAGLRPRAGHLERRLRHAAAAVGHHQLTGAGRIGVAAGVVQVVLELGRGVHARAGGVEQPLGERHGQPRLADDGGHHQVRGRRHRGERPLEKLDGVGAAALDRGERRRQVGRHPRSAGGLEQHPAGLVGVAGPQCVPCRGLEARAVGGLCRLVGQARHHREVGALAPATALGAAARGPVRRRLGAGARAARAGLVVAQPSVTHVGPRHPLLHGLAEVHHGEHREEERGVAEPGEEEPDRRAAGRHDAEDPGDADAPELVGDVPAVEGEDGQQVDDRPGDVGERDGFDHLPSLPRRERALHLVGVVEAGRQQVGGHAEQDHAGERTGQAHPDAAPPAPRLLAVREPPERRERDRRADAVEPVRHGVAQLVDQHRYEHDGDPDEQEDEPVPRPGADPVAAEDRRDQEERPLHVDRDAPDTEAAALCHGGQLTDRRGGTLPPTGLRFPP